jgi:phosphoglycolate phosphatase
MSELAQRLPLFIVSNCQAGYIEIFLAQSGLAGSVRDFECWGRTKATKSENLRRIIQRNGLMAPWYVGDTDGDRTAARDNAVKFVYASYGFGTLQEWDARIDAFEQLAELLPARA